MRWKPLRGKDTVTVFGDHFSEAVASREYGAARAVGLVNFGKK